VNVLILGKEEETNLFDICLLISKANLAQFHNGYHDFLYFHFPGLAWILRNKRWYQKSILSALKNNH
jgi:hypothetical protein